jgi:hypothetical protein
VLLKRISDAGTPAISVDFGGAETLKTDKDAFQDYSCTSNTTLEV